MHQAQAHALRRGTTALAVIAATLGAHVAGMGFHGLTLRTPFMIGFAVAAAALLGRRHGAFHPRGAGRLVVLLALLQAVAHTLLATAPWAMGLSGHCATALPTTGMLVAHLAATCLLTLCLLRLERMLAAAVGLVRAVRRLLHPAVPRSCRGVRLLIPHSAAPAFRIRTSAPSRGPPAHALT